MKGLETFLFAATLVLVPGLAWLTGRLMGRRNCGISSVLIAGVVAALVPFLARLAIQAGVDARPFADAALFQLRRTLDNVEVGMFLVSFGVFMTMLGWTATPVMAPKSRTS